MATTLQERLGDRHNRLNAIRLVLASVVILGHAWPLTGADGPSLELLSDVAVNGFFVLSGYLIAESRVRTRLVPYLWRRFLRIYPAFLVSLLAGLNLFIGMFNLVPLLPLDGGHIAGALYEGLRRTWARVRRRPDPGFVDVAKLLPVAYCVAGALLLMSVVLIAGDLVAPISIS